MRRASLVTGTSLTGTMKWHTADKNGRMYLCRCSPSFRIGPGLNHCLGKRRKRTQATLNRWLKCGPV